MVHFSQKIHVNFLFSFIQFICREDWEEGRRNKATHKWVGCKIHYWKIINNDCVPFLVNHTIVIEMLYSLKIVIFMVTVFFVGLAWKDLISNMRWCWLKKEIRNMLLTWSRSSEIVAQKVGNRYFIISSFCNVTTLFQNGLNVFYYLKILLYFDFFCKVITNMLIIWRIHSKKKKMSLKIISQETTVTNSRKYLMNWPTLFSQHQIRSACSCNELHLIWLLKSIICMCSRSTYLQISVCTVAIYYMWWVKSSNFNNY